MTRSNPGRPTARLLARLLVTLVGTLVATLGLLGGTAHARSVKVTKSIDVGTRLFVLKKVTVDHSLGQLRIRGWDKQLVRISAVKKAPDGATIRRLKVHVNINKNGNGRVEIRTGVLMKVRSARNPQQASRLISRGQKIESELSQLRRQPKPWSTRIRQQIRKLYKERLAIVRSLGEAVTSKLVARLRAVPIKGASLQLTLHIPRRVIVEGKTSKGDIDVADLRGPVILRSRRGQIYARNVKGAVTTRTDKGHQFLSSIRGSVSANSTDGDLRLRSIRGPQILANLVRGQIIGYGLMAPLIRLTTTQGKITVTATLKSNGRFEVRTRRGDIDVRLASQAGYRLRAETRHGSLRLPRNIRLRGTSPLRKRGRYGLGRAKVDLRTVYGTVSLR